MILITHFLANIIFMMYRDRFGNYDFNDMPIGEEILLPHGLHFVKTDKNKYGIKWYAWDMRDWEIFKGTIELRLAEIIDENTQIHPKTESFTEWERRCRPYTRKYISNTS